MWGFVKMHTPADWQRQIREGRQAGREERGEMQSRCRTVSALLPSSGASRDNKVKSTYISHPPSSLLWSRYQSREMRNPFHSWQVNWDTCIQGCPFHFPENIHSFRLTVLQKKSDVTPNHAIDYKDTMLYHRIHFYHCHFILKEFNPESSQKGVPPNINSSFSFLALSLFC